LGRRREACSGMVVGAWAGVSRGEGSGWREEDAPVLERREWGLAKAMMGGKMVVKEDGRRNTYVPG
jgi:hypothetical protein